MTNTGGNTHGKQRNTKNPATRTRTRTGTRTGTSTCWTRSAGRDLLDEICAAVRSQSNRQQLIEHINGMGRRHCISTSDVKHQHRAEDPECTNDQACVKTTMDLKQAMDFINTCNHDRLKNGPDPNMSMDMSEALNTNRR